MSFNGLMLSAPSISRRKSKTVNAPSVYLADSLAHDIIDSLLLERETPTVCKFALMHRCRKPTNMGLPCVDDSFISAPCCSAPLYSLQTLSATNFTDKQLGSCADINFEERTTYDYNVPFCPGTSTPKQFSGQMSRLDTERNCTSSTSSGSSCTCEHHETPSGLNPRQNSGFKRVTVEPTASASSSTNNHFPRYLVFKSNSFSEPSCSYKESLHVNTNFDHLCRKLFQNMSSDNTEDHGKENGPGSNESVIRHPSYFSDSGSVDAVDCDADRTSAELNNSVFVETRSNCCSPFRDEETSPVNGITSLYNSDLPMLNKSVATQTNLSYLSHKAAKLKEKVKSVKEVSPAEEEKQMCEKMTETGLQSPGRGSNFSSMSDIFVVATEESREQLKQAALRSV